MKREIELAALGQILGLTAICATLIVTPWASYDPINVPKLAVIVIGGFMALGAMAANYQLVFLAKYRLLQIFALAFVIDLLVVFFVSGTNPAQEFFGTFGRATGFLAYVSLCLLLVAAAVAASQTLLKRLAWALLLSGGVSVGYGLLQSAGGDPTKWVNQYSPVIGFLGNPNFQSSFVALSAVMAFSMCLSGSINMKIRLGFFSYVLLALYVVHTTKSQQGFLVFAGGAVIVILVWIAHSKLKFLIIPSVISSIIGFIVVTLGTLNSGPLAGLLYKASVTYRGDYWRAGWKMATENPLFGVGLDSYGDWYRRTRTLEATVRRGPDMASNAAHNVLIDLASNGGFPLLIIYVFLLALVVISLIKLLKRSNGFDPIVVGLIAVWVAYQAQSVISLNQLGLAVWGWIISGLIIGYEINTREKEVIDDPNGRKGRSANAASSTKVAPRTLVGITAGLLVGLLVGIQPLIASSKFKSALQSGSAPVVEQAAYIWPLDPAKMVKAADLLFRSGFNAEGLKICVDGVARFPDEYALWNILYRAPGSTAEQKAQALEQMKRLDPLNSELK
jgi:O-antigen ligase